MTEFALRSASRVLADVRDAPLVGAAVLHAAAIAVAPHPVVLGVLFWWTANTVAHNFIHNPFFRDRRANAAFSAWMTLLLGVPQALWRARHLEHHAQDRAPGIRVDLRRAPGMRRDVAICVGAWALLVGVAPGLVVSALIPGLALGLTLSWLQGHFEHAGGVTGTDGRLYNALFVNDGLHPEHHARPGTHWADLPGAPRCAARRSPFPAVLRWLDVHPLDVLERVALALPPLRNAVLRSHERAFARLRDRLPAVRTAIVVGGGLFPRSALVLQRALPGVRITVIDRDAEHLRVAASHLPPNVRVIARTYDPKHATADLVVLPLAFVGDRDVAIAASRAAVVVTHDWLWRRRSGSVVVAWWLLKRMSLVVPPLAAQATEPGAPVSESVR